MRLPLEIIDQPKLGDMRIVTKFLWLPKTKQNKKFVPEVRWLEKASWREQYRGQFDTSDGWVEVGSGWVDEK